VSFPYLNGYLGSIQTWFLRFQDVLYFAQMRWPGHVYARTEGN